MRSAGFRVLKAPDVPSVLLELGFLSNPDDEKKLTSEQWRDRMADSVTEAIDGYFAKRVARMPF
jgi:N-acetylmuramoyl-L-alanine amidase